MKKFSTDRTNENKTQYNINAPQQNEDENLLENQNQSNSFDEYLRIKFSVSSKIGNKQETGKGRDAMVIIQKPLDGFYFFGVFDSHGSSGREVSETLSNFFQNYIESNYKILINFPKDKEETTAKFLKESIFKAENYLKINNIDLKYSGSTVHLATIIRRKLFVVNIGNSRSVLYRIVEGDKFAIELSDDHVPSSKPERYRIYKNGGVIERLILGGQKTGPLRIWDKKIENGPGLQITRSLGDQMAKSLGVISEPEIQWFQLTKDDIFIIMCTDGFWDMMYSTQACYYVQKYMKVHKNKFDNCSQFLINKSLKKKFLDQEKKLEKREDGQILYDDITTIIAALNYQIIFIIYSYHNIQNNIQKYKTYY